MPLVKKHWANNKLGMILGNVVMNKTQQKFKGYFSQGAFRTGIFIAGPMGYRINIPPNMNSASVATACPCDCPARR